MPHEVTDEVTLEELKFLRPVNKSKYSQIFQVEWRGQICALKVYHGEVPDPHEERPMDIFTCESTAYRRLKEKGLCAKGIVPDFYGTVTNIESTRWPELHKFHNDELPANAVLIEYIPKLERIHMGNRTEQRMNRLREILVEIHAARVLHDDVYPRNMGLCPGTNGAPDRLLWFDFDRAETFPLDKPLPERQAEWFEEEQWLMNDWVTYAPINPKTGEVRHLWIGYMTLPDEMGEEESCMIRLESSQ